MEKIKVKKGNYCQKYEKYDQKAKEIWKKVYKYEEEMKYSSRMYEVYTTEISNLRHLEIEFEEIRGRLLVLMEDKKKQ